MTANTQNTITISTETIDAGTPHEALLTHYTSGDVAFTLDEQAPHAASLSIGTTLTDGFTPEQARALLALLAHTDVQIWAALNTPLSFDAEIEIATAAYKAGWQEGRAALLHEVEKRLAARQVAVGQEGQSDA